jgi:hypothetical protein
LCGVLLSAAFLSAELLNALPRLGSSLSSLQESLSITLENGAILPPSSNRIYIEVISEGEWKLFEKEQRDNK